VSRRGVSPERGTEGGSNVSPEKGKECVTGLKDFESLCVTGLKDFEILSPIPQ
jgi:hypothetical protein